MGIAFGRCLQSKPGPATAGNYSPEGQWFRFLINFLINRFLIKILKLVSDLVAYCFLITCFLKIG